MFETVSDISNRAWLKTRDFQLCRSIDQLRSYAFHTATTEVSLDWETTSLDVEKALPVGLGISTDPKHGLYIPVGHLVGAEHNLPLPAVLEILWEIDTKFISWWWGYKYDGEVMWQRFRREMQRWGDAMFAAYLENPNINVYGLKPTAMRLLGLDAITFEEVTKGRNFAHLDPSDQNTIDYGCSDVALALEIRRLPNVARAISTDPQWGQKFIYDLEWKVDYCVRDAERNKCWIDRAKLGELQTWTKARIQTLQEEIYSLAGGEFNIGSSVALGRKLVELGIPISETTRKSEQVQTKKEVLLKYTRYHPIITLIVQWKELSVQCRNYIDKLVRGVDTLGPLIKFPFHHIGVPTGRMKAGGEGKAEEAYAKGVIDLNVQSLPDPKKQPYLPNIRSALVANDPRQDSREFIIVAIDYQQVELRIAANMSREPAWIEAFAKGVDIHLTNAKLAYRLPTLSKDDPRRGQGKTMSFAILYGGSAWTVSDHGGIQLEQAQALVDNFFGGAPILHSWIKSWQKMAQRQRFVKTAFGRIRPLTEYYPENKTFWQLSKQERRVWMKGDREAINDPIQGGAADVFKIACVKVRKLIEERQWQNDVMMILFVHDELVLRVRKSMLGIVVPELQKAMEFDVKGWPVSLKTDAEVGYTDNPNWGIMCDYSTYMEFAQREKVTLVGAYLASLKKKEVTSVDEFLNRRELHHSALEVVTPEDEEETELQDTLDEASEWL